jgi:hypothetical protein
VVFVEYIISISAGNALIIFKRLSLPSLQVQLDAHLSNPKPLPSSYRISSRIVSYSSPELVSYSRPSRIVSSSFNWPSSFQRIRNEMHRHCTSASNLNSPTIALEYYTDLLGIGQRVVDDGTMHKRQDGCSSFEHYASAIAAPRARIARHVTLSEALKRPSQGSSFPESLRPDFYPQRYTWLNTSQPS